MKLIASFSTFIVGEGGIRKGLIMKEKNKVIDATKDVLKGAIKVVAGAYILKNTIENACIKTACNMVNKYVFKDDENMFD